MLIGRSPGRGRKKGGRNLCVLSSRPVKSPMEVPRRDICLNGLLGVLHMAKQHAAAQGDRLVLVCPGLSWLYPSKSCTPETLSPRQTCAVGHPTARPPFWQRQCGFCFLLCVFLVCLLFCFTTKLSRALAPNAIWGSLLLGAAQPCTPPRGPSSVPSPRSPGSQLRQPCPESRLPSGRGREKALVRRESLEQHLCLLPLSPKLCP